MHRIFCSGGAGFLGSALCNRLLDDGHEVTAFDDMSRGNAKRLHIGVRTIQGDVRDAYAVSKAIQGHDIVVHMAMVQGTQVFTEAPERTMDIAVRGTLNVLDACGEVRDFMLLSSSEAYQGERDRVPTAEDVWLSVPDVLNPRFAYGGGKLAMELMAVNRGGFDRMIVARPHNAIGPDAGYEHVVPQFACRMAELVARQPDGVIDFPIMGTGLETRSYCYISDTTDALALLLNKAPLGKSIWHVGTQDERSINQLAQAVADCFGREIRIVPGQLPKGSPPRRCPDISKLRSLGYEPKVAFGEAIRKTVDWYARQTVRA